MKTQKITALAILTAMALITFLIENLLPSLYLPGVKIGLSNIFTLFTLIYFGFSGAATVLTVRTILGGLITGNPFSIIYSLGAGAISLILSAVIYNCFREKTSLVAISILGATVHNIAQTIIFVLITKTVEYYCYAALLAVVGALSGAVVGILITLIIAYLPSGLKEKFLLDRQINLK